MTQLESDLAQVLNAHCQENESNTPDFILAKFLLGCLAAFSSSVNAREEWYGRTPVMINEKVEPTDPNNVVDEE